jgi:hypothetical protein
MMMEAATRLLLLGFVLPLWWGAGLLDWWLHRRSGIERRAGARESMLHLLMLAEAGIPVLALLWLQADAWLLLLCAAAFVAHQCTVHADLQWVEGRRAVGPLEQMVHGFQEVLPLAALLLLAASHWPQVLALFGAGDQPAVWRPRLKADPLPAGAIAFVLCGSALVVAAYLEELWRCLRQRTPGAGAPR